MAVYTNEPVIPSLIENTTMQRNFRDGVATTYYITPNEGYVLHDKGMDDAVIDEETFEETGEVLLGFRRSTASCAANYDFVANPREFYAVPEDSVPEDRIFGGSGNNDNEIM